MRNIVLSVVACCAVLAIAPVTALAHGHHHKRHHHSRIHHRTFGHDWSQSGSSSTTTSSEENAGTVTSFTGGVLTITLNNGQTVTGNVTGDTEIECQAPEMSSSLSSHDRGDDNGDRTDNHGDRGDDNGNDQGDDGAENANCSSADLTTGAVVHEARLAVTSAGATWDKVELVTASTSTTDSDNDND